MGFYTNSEAVARNLEETTKKLLTKKLGKRYVDRPFQIGEGHKDTCVPYKHSLRQF
jgi:hypothetical protein